MTDGSEIDCPYCDTPLPYRGAILRRRATVLTEPLTFLLSLPGFYWHCLQEHPDALVLNEAEWDEHMDGPDRPFLAAMAAVGVLGLVVLAAGLVASSLAVKIVGVWFGGAWVIMAVAAYGEAYVSEDDALEPADLEGNEDTAP